MLIIIDKMSSTNDNWHEVTPRKKRRWSWKINDDDECMLELNEFIVDGEINVSPLSFNLFYRKYGRDHLERCIATLIVNRRLDYPYKRKFAHTAGEAYEALIAGTYLKVTTDVVAGRLSVENEKRHVDFVSLTGSYYVNILSDLFNEHVRLKSSVKKNLCLYDKFFTREGATFVAKRVIERACSTKMIATHSPDKYGIDTHGLREAAWDVNKKVFIECTTFKADFAKAICDYFGSRYVLDPCGGWGNRALGCTAAESVVKYVCTDPNPRLVDGYAAIKEFIEANPYTQAEIIQHHIPFEQYDQQMLQDDFTETGNPDLVFTSPPFGLHEIYNQHDEHQSTYTISTHKAWISEWFYPFLDHAWETVAVGGYLALYIGDAGGKIVEPMLDYMQLKERPYWGCIGCRNETWYPFCIYVWEKI